MVGEADIEDFMEKFVEDMKKEIEDGYYVPSKTKFGEISREWVRPDLGDSKVQIMEKLRALRLGHYRKGQGANNKVLHSCETIAEQIKAARDHFTKGHA